MKDIVVGQSVRCQVSSLHLTSERCYLADRYELAPLGGRDVRVGE